MQDERFARYHDGLYFKFASIQRLFNRGNSIASEVQSDIRAFPEIDLESKF